MKSAIILLLSCHISIALAENVAYHVWNNPIPEKAVGNPGQTCSVPKGKTFGDVMDLAALKNPQGYGFNFTRFDFGRMITSIGGVSQDPGNGLYWMLFQLDDEPKPENPPTRKNLASYGVDGMIIERDDIFLFWLTNMGHASPK